tara:strand:+ start:66 stop:452 length:387 start_codon:yes stop_codon:yes gene_type:complete
MKKLLSLFIVGFLLFGFSQKEEKKADWKKDNLKGKVKSVTETQYRSVEKFGEVQKDSLRRKETRKYDDNGNGTEYAKYNSDGSLKYKMTFKYEYDSKNNWIKAISFEVKNDAFKTPKEIIEREIEYYD